jgi:hypothetical protein
MFGLSSLFHKLSFALVKKGQQKFEQSTHQLQQVQEARLRAILANVSNSETGYKLGLTASTTTKNFCERTPISDYEDWQKSIVQQRQSGDSLISTEHCERYQPTSGSTSQIKWIPYTPSFLKELDNAINPWMADLYEHYPGIRRGKHYWSLSWVPSELREQASSVNNDLKLLPWWKRLFMTYTMAVPDQVSLAPTSELSIFASLCYLCASRDLTLVSIWSPTFLISLLEQLQLHKDDIAKVLSKGQWGADYADLKHLKAPRCSTNADYLMNWNGDISSKITHQLWPHLSLISAWDTSSSEQWAKELQALFPHAAFQGKGLWATEGVITIPYKNNYTLALDSHFYEFEDLATGDILFSWELKTGMRVRPIITTGSGLLRYRTKDQLEVEGFLNQCPTMRFISRLSGTDMVGEKMAPEAALEIMNKLTTSLPIQTVSLLAIPANKEFNQARYVLLATGSSDQTGAVQQQLEAELNQHFHYKLARELKQLAPAAVIISTDAIALYNQLRLDTGAVAGNIKVEPLQLCPQAANLMPLIEDTLYKMESFT